MISLLRPILRYVPRRFLYAMLGLFTLQAMLGAAGTAALALAGRHFGEPRTFVLYVVCYLVLALAPNAVIVFIRRTEMRGYLSSYQVFLNERFERHRGRPALWSNRGRREVFLTAIGSEAETYLGAVTYTALDMYAYAVTIGLNTLALTLTIDASFAWSLVASVAFSAVTYALQHRTIEGLVEVEQTARIDLGAHVLKAWDNVLLDNHTARSNYLAKLNSKLHGTRDLAGRSAFRAEATVFLLNVTSSVPVYAAIAWVLYRDAATPALLVSTLATIPRQIETLRTFRFFYQQLNNARIFGVRLRAALTNSALSEVDLASLIKMEAITIDGKAVPSVPDALAMLAANERRRVIIRGQNGAGKSSLLLLAHAQIQDSVYLPPAADLELGEPAAEESTGQRYVRQLRACADARVLLLDEWDANLDPENRRLIERLLDQLAESASIIEVRHH